MHILPESFLILSNFVWNLYFTSNILSRIEGSRQSWRCIFLLHGYAATLRRIPMKQKNTSLLLQFWWESSIPNKILEIKWSLVISVCSGVFALHNFYFSLGICLVNEKRYEHLNNDFIFRTVLRMKLGEWLMFRYWLI